MVDIIIILTKSVLCLFLILIVFLMRYVLNDISMFTQVHQKMPSLLNSPYTSHTPSKYLPLPSNNHQTTLCPKFNNEPERKASKLSPAYSVAPSMLEEDGKRKKESIPQLLLTRMRTGTLISKKSLKICITV